ncbi:DNA cytosine methyltransferase [Pseudoroseomonas ludipueritiae]|uniref:Cytosine-specific methyltransferase n=1 Tax=Pseudoroseomonas ludipueritiae TaxID=198093 RepID=A0ABR7RES3_9PROT|nr:DNA cytosine methyltransferase [Pseudoroseomonas ludipueritiae]
MRFGSVCSGIEAASIAWEPLGWSASFLSEIAAFPRAVLTHRFPSTPLRGDFTEIQHRDHDPIDLLVGGTPCQSFSVAGLRRGMADDRGNLALEYLRLADRLRPRWLLWENVPGVLSSNGGRDFGSFLGGLVQLGYGFAYRVLDAQFFGLAQRRKRVFVVGCAGDWRRAAAVLLEPASLRGNSPPRREAGERASRGVGFGVVGNGECGEGLSPLRAKGGDAGGGSEMLVAFGGNNTSGPIDVAAALNACKTAAGRQDFETETFIAHTLRAQAQSAHAADLETYVAFDTTQITSASNYSSPKAGDPCHPLAAGAHPPAIAFQSSQSGVRTGDAHATLDANNGARRHNGVMSASGVRRLTPRECERLQGFPDDHTLIPYRNKPAADGPRYQALGNSMAVPVMRWIGSRIQMQERIAA